VMALREDVQSSRLEDITATSQSADLSAFLQDVSNVYT
jgi:hypothetical protein